MSDKPINQTVHGRGHPASAFPGICGRAGAAGVLARMVAPAARRWLLLSDYGATAQRNMTIAWACICGLVLGDTIWLANSPMVFAASNWTSLLKTGLWTAFLCTSFAFALRRLEHEGDRTARLLTSFLQRADLAWRSILPIIALMSALVTYSYLATATTLPLRDDLLAGIDRGLGFYWPSFLSFVDSRPLLFKSLVTAYDSIAAIGIGLIVWLALFRRGERLAEFIAVLSVSVIVLSVVMLIAPAAGAFAFYKPAPQSLAYLVPSEMWTFSREFTKLRDGALSIIDLSAAQGVVSFPSFHTILAIVTVYPLRDTRWLMSAVMVPNGMMMVATMPVGGHHLSDVLAGVAVAVGAIVIVRRASPFRAIASQSDGALTVPPAF